MLSQIYICLFLWIAVNLKYVLSDDFNIRYYNNLATVPSDLASLFNVATCTPASSTVSTQFCGNVLINFARNTYIKANVTIPHFQKNVIFEQGVRGTPSATFHQLTLSSESSAGVLISATSVFFNYTTKTQIPSSCLISSEAQSYFFRGSLLLTDPNPLFKTTIYEANNPLAVSSSLYQLNINTCHPSCLTCTGPSANHCTSCAQISTLTSGQGTCSCTTTTDYMYQGQCYTSCPTNTGSYLKTCLLSSNCSTWNSSTGKCSTCDSGYTLFIGNCVNTQKPAGYKLISGEYVLFVSTFFSNISYYVQGVFFSQDFSQISVANSGFNFMFTYGTSLNLSLISQCGQDQLFGGFMISYGVSIITFPVLTIKSRYIQVTFKYYLIDFDSVANYQNDIYFSDGTTNTPIQLSAAVTSGYFCGFENKDFTDIFLFQEQVNGTTAHPVIKNYYIQNSNTFTFGTSTVQKGYFGIREITVVGIDCSDLNCISCPFNVCSSCIQGYYVNTSNTCTICDNICTACTGSTTCQSCILNASLNASSYCVCNSNYFHNVVNNTCQQCYDINCDTCSGAASTDCTVCKSGYYLNSTSKACIQCQANCLTCSNGNSCNSCINGLQLSLETYLCVQCSTQIGFYTGGNLCKKCDPACYSCTGPANTQCIVCNVLYFILDTTTKACVQCPNEIYKSSSSLNCQSCNYQCPLCSDAQFNYNNLTIDTSVTNSGNYCLVCECNQCDSSYYIQNSFQCTSNCSSIGQNYEMNSSFTACICKSGYPYMVYNSVTNLFDCSTISPYGYFCNSSNHCKSCQSNCKSCESSTSCSVCNSGYYLWFGSCYQDCFTSLNIIPNTSKGTCECQQGTTLTSLSTPINGSSYICLQDLKVVSVNVCNSYMQNSNIQLPSGFQDNLIVIKLNRDLVNQEYNLFGLTIDTGTLTLNVNYKIISTSQSDSNTVQLVVEVDQNRYIHTMNVSFSTTLITLNLQNTVLVTRSYTTKNQAASVSAGLQSITSMFSSGGNSAAQQFINFLKAFQIMCMISNFIQVFPLIYLIRDYLPFNVKFCTLFGASLMFKQTPSPSDISFSISSNNSKNDSSSEQLTSTLKDFGLTENLYESFTIIHILVVISACLIVFCLFFRFTLKGKQYTLSIVNKTTNFICSYLQSSITAILFSISYSWTTSSNKFFPIFQYVMYFIQLADLILLLLTQTQSYLYQNIPNIYADLNIKAQGAKSYLVISFLKKYTIVFLCLNCFSHPLIYTILTAILFGMNGFYILYYRFFEKDLINIVKIFQEFVNCLLFIFLSYTIQKMTSIMETDIVSDNNLNQGLMLGQIITIVMLCCLAISTFLFIYRQIQLIRGFISKIQQYQQTKKQKQIDILSFINSFELETGTNFSKKPPIGSCHQNTNNEISTNTISSS